MFWCRPVKVIRLVSQHTVEEIVLNRAEAKMKLTSAVIAEGQVSKSSGGREAIWLIVLSNSLVMELLDHQLV